MATTKDVNNKLQGNNSTTSGSTSASLTSLMFPIDLLNPGNDGACMTFFINTIKNGRSQVTFTTGNSKPKNGHVEVSSDYGEMPVINQVSTGIQKDNGSSTKVFSNNYTRSNQSITLPMPKNLTYRLQSTWSKTDLGQIGMAIDQATDIKDITASGGAQLAKQMALQTVGSIASKFAGGALKGKELVSLATATVANDYAETLFKNVESRNFSWSWTLTPRNETEAAAIDDIIRLFRFHMLPEFRKDMGNGNAFLLYPSSFDIVFFQDGSPNKYIPRISTCALTSMDTDYTPNGGYIKTVAGSPQSYTLSLQFVELSILHKDMVGTDNTGTNTTF